MTEGNHLDGSSWMGQGEGPGKIFAQKISLPEKIHDTKQGRRPFRPAEYTPPGHATP
jgi:hypothetical protein